MNIYFSGIGGVGLGPLAEIAVDAGYTVAGSDQSSSLMTDQLKNRGVSIETDQSGIFLQSIQDKHPIDWLVYSSALSTDHPELLLAKKLGIRISKRDELLAHIIKEKNLKLIAVAGTHGKTTTTALLVWAFQQLGIPVSYSVGTTMSFGPSGRFDPNSEYFVYECDEYDRNFLQFHPFLSVITALGYDHPDTYPTNDDYIAAFRQFLDQSDGAIMWQTDKEKLGNTPATWALGDNEVVDVSLAGEHNRRNASLVLKAFERLHIEGPVTEVLNRFPGIDRRFEKIAENLYSDYGHHPAEIKATLQLAHELNDTVILVYQPHQNIRQHEIRDDYTDDVFKNAAEIYWLPTYLTREDPSLAVLSPQELTSELTETVVHFADLDDKLWQNIQEAREQGALVLGMGAGTIDDWIRSAVN